MLPFAPDLDESAQDLVDQFYEVASGRKRVYALVPDGEGGMRTLERPQPIEIAEVRGWLSEMGERGARRRFLFSSIRTLDRVWRKAWAEAQY
jgi:hypothetical protein